MLCRGSIRYMCALSIWTSTDIHCDMAHKDQMLEILCWLRTMPGSERKPKPMAWRQIGLALVLICAASMFGQAHGETYEESKMYSYDKYTEGPRLTGHVQNWATLIQNYILQVNKNVYQSWSLPTCTMYALPCKLHSGTVEPHYKGCRYIHNKTRL